MKRIENGSNGNNLSKLIDALFTQNLLTHKQLNDARERQNKLIRSQKSLQDLLVEMGFVKEDELIEASSKAFDITAFDVNKNKIDSSASKLISDKVARRYGVFPVCKKGDTLILAMNNPNDIIALDDIRNMTGMQVKPVLMKKSDIVKCIEKYYNADDNLYDILKSLKINKSKIAGNGSNGNGETTFDLKDNKYKNSVAVRLANFMLSDAIKVRASDIHVEPQEKYVVVRYRIDGNLKNILRFPTVLHPALIARIKILTKLNIAETKKAQDGRVSILINERKIDLRISTMPTFYGEKVVMRLLDPKEAKIELNRLGLQEEELNVLVERVGRDQGMILVTGPTGSGKTSTLYAALNFIKGETKNIVTIEDPVEYLIEGISQMQINPAKDISFANGLRNILRQDPNVILVGEIRDRKTADIAFRASLTGHLVFSTLHTNNAISTITRLLDIGLEPYIIASSIILIVSQRLIRLTCPHCKEEYEPDSKLLDKFRAYTERLDIDKFFRGRGCKHCNFTGYFGRTAVFEMLKINENIKNLISNKASERAIFKEAKKDGLKALAESGIEKVAGGITTLEEVAICAYEVEEKARKPRHINGEFNGYYSGRTISYVRDVIYPRNGHTTERSHFS